MVIILILMVIMWFIFVYKIKIKKNNKIWYNICKYKKKKIGLNDKIMK